MTEGRKGTGTGTAATAKAGTEGAARRRFWATRETWRVLSAIWEEGAHPIDLTVREGGGLVVVEARAGSAGQIERWLASARERTGTPPANI